jgi:uncharacterized protein (DUF2235 family)
MSKNIVICCDGTGNEYGDNNSNVVNLYQTLVVDGTKQVAYYHPGVGTAGSPTAGNRVTQWWTKVMGLAFGAGLLGNIADAYRFLMDTYQDGDKVFLFGFSRGAYTARALAGVLHMYGLLCPGNDGLIPYIIRMYARKSRKAGGMTRTFEVAEGFKETFCRHCPLHLVGVWDTVSSVGWIWSPLQLPYTAQNPDMRNGLHAISIDERRCYFRNNLWGKALPDHEVQQVWFAGVHSDIGGSYPPDAIGLSQITLQWMLYHAVKLELIVDMTKVRKVLGKVPPKPIPPNPLQPINKSLHGFLWWLLEFLPHSYYNSVTKKKSWRIPLGAPRTIPLGSAFHSTVLEKVNYDPTYKPTNLPDGWEKHVVPFVEKDWPDGPPWPYLSSRQ